MQFLFPSFLWALLCLVIPIIIHIFNFRRTKRVYFSNVNLLKEVKTETNSFRRLKHFLILMSRLGFLGFLVFAFAQPFIPSKNQKNIQNLSGLVSIYLDNSFSMQSEAGNEKYFDLATGYVNELLDVFPKDARFQLITNNFENKEQYPVPANEIENRLTETKFSNAYRDLPSIYKRQFNLMERYSATNKNQVFWFSDFQKSTLGDLNKIKLDSLNQYYIIPIKSEKTPNLMIDSVWLENPFIKALESNQINVRLKSFSTESYQDLTLKLFIEDKQVSTTAVNIAAGSSATTSFNFTVQDKGIKPCKITFDDFPVVFDNEYFFVINASPTIDILHLYEDKQNNYIENVYENESVFKVNGFNANNLDHKRIESAGLVILNGVNTIEGELANTLKAFVQKGGSLVVFPSKNQGTALSGFLASLSISGIKAEKTDSLGTGKANELALLEIQNPFFRGMFEKVPANMNMPYANPVVSWNNVGENLLNFKNRKPYLSRFNAGQGKIYLFASPLEANYSNFPKHAIFVPVMYKIASLSKAVGERPAYTFQEKTIRVKLTKIVKNQVYKLIKDKTSQSDRIELVPAQRIVNDELILEMPEQSLEAGYYKLVLDKSTEALLAFNYDKAESEMNFYGFQEIQSAFSGKKNVQIYDFAKNKNFVQEFKEKNIQVNLWKYMLMIALGFFLAEILLIRLL